MRVFRFELPFPAYRLDPSREFLEVNQIPGPTAGRVAATPLVVALQALVEMRGLSQVVAPIDSGLEDINEVRHDVAGKEDVAGPTRLELATSGVTGRRSNQLNYDPAQGARHNCLAGDLPAQRDVLTN